MSYRYPNGQPITLSTTIKDRNNNLVDAGTLTLVVTKPDGTTQAYASPSHDSTGTYHQDIGANDLTLNGHYQYVWTSTGTGAGVSVGEFDVFDPTEPVILSLQDAKDALNIPQTTTTFDVTIQAYLDTLTDDLERVTGGPAFNRTISNERVRVTQGYGSLCLRKRPVVSVTSIADEWSGETLALTDTVVDTNSAIVTRRGGLPFMSRGPWYLVTYVAGWGTSIPPAFNAAARIIIAHLYEVEFGPGIRPNAGMQETVLPGMSFAIPNRAAELLRKFTLEAYV